MANLKDTIVLGNLTVTGSVTASSILGSTGNATSADYPTGFASRPSTITWGTLAESASYVTRWDDPSGGSVAFGHSSGQTSMQIDGYYYQAEGAYQVLDNRYMWNHTATPNGTAAATGMVYVMTRMAIKGNGASYNEGLRILPASNGWSNIFFSGDDSLYGTHSGGWLLGRRGAAGTHGAAGDFTIEHNGSSGFGLTLPTNGSRPKWAGLELAYKNDCKNPTDYYWANVKVSSTSSETSNPTFGYIYVHNYIQADIIVPKEQSEVMYIGSEDGSSWGPILLELGAHEVISLSCMSQSSEIRTTTSLIKPVHLHTELGNTGNAFLSGTMSLLRANSITSLDNPTRIYMSIESNGICLPGNDDYGRIYPGAGNCGYIGTSSNYFWYMYTNNLYATSIYPRGGNKTGTIGSTSNYFNYGYFQNLYKAGASVSTSDIRLKNNIVKTDLQALDIVTKLNVLNYQLNDFTDDQQKLKRQKKKALEKMKQLPKTKETREVRKQLQQIISTPNQSGVQDIGISAQELESLLPQKYRATFVLKEATHNYSDQRFIKDENLVYLLLKAIQEQQEQIVELQNKVQGLL